MTQRVQQQVNGQPGVGQRIRQLRHDHGLSQRELSVPGVSYAYISRLEGDHRTASLAALVGIAEKLGTTGLYLLAGDWTAPCPVCRRAADQVAQAELAKAQAIRELRDAVARLDELGELREELQQVLQELEP